MKRYLTYGAAVLFGLVLAQASAWGDPPHSGKAKSRATARSSARPGSVSGNVHITPGKVTPPSVSPGGVSVGRNGGQTKITITDPSFRPGTITPPAVSGSVQFTPPSKKQWQDAVGTVTPPSGTLPGVSVQRGDGRTTVTVTDGSLNPGGYTPPSWATTRPTMPKGSLGTFTPPSGTLPSVGVKRGDGQTTITLKDGTFNPGGYTPPGGRPTVTGSVNANGATGTVSNGAGSATGSVSGNGASASASTGGSSANASASSNGASGSVSVGGASASVSVSGDGNGGVNINVGGRLP